MKDNLKIKFTKVDRPKLNIVNFGKIIGKYCDPIHLQFTETSWGVIVSGSAGAHIIPAQPNENTPILDEAIRHSLKRAITSNIPPTVKAVAAIWKQTELSIRYYVEVNPSEKDLNSMITIAGEVFADFPGLKNLYQEFTVIVGNLNFQNDDEIVYYRK
jgi:hypothetical protein